MLRLIIHLPQPVTLFSVKMGLYKRMKRSRRDDVSRDELHSSQPFCKKAANESVLN